MAGRTGVAIYSIFSRKWKLFGNESQEKDFIVTGGLLWWDDFVIMGCYSLLQQSDELRLYPKDTKLDNRFAKIILMAAPVMLINLFKDQLVIITVFYFFYLNFKTYLFRTLDSKKKEFYLKIKKKCFVTGCIYCWWFCHDIRNHQTRCTNRWFVAFGHVRHTRLVCSSGVYHFGDNDKFEKWQCN